MIRNLTRRQKSTMPTAQERRTLFWPIQSTINQMFEDFYSPFESTFPVSQELENITLIPSVDIIDTKDSIKIETELPGMGSDDIKVTIDNGTLTITGEKKMSQHNKDKNYLIREVNYGYYQPAPSSSLLSF
jgi:HSP20 family protein